MKKEKCKFAQTEIRFLGHLVFKNQIQMDKSKVTTNRDWPNSTKVTKLRLFFGLANYYRRFIVGFFKITIPLTDLLKNERELECQTTFQRLKDAITS